MIFSKFFNFFEKYFFEKSSRMVKVIFAAIDKSTTKTVFHRENPEISTILGLKLVGGRGSVFCSAAVENSKKSIFFFFERVFHTQTNNLNQSDGDFSTFMTFWNNLLSSSAILSLLAYSQTLLSGYVLKTYI